MTYLEKSNEFIKFMEEHKSVTHFHVYNASGSDIWEVYYALTGYVYGKYFAVDLQKITNIEPYTKIVETTKCNIYMEDILSKFGLL